MSRPWPTPFVGAHLLLTEPGMINNSWDSWPPEWDVIRFDAIDVLFISPFRVKTSELSFNLAQVEGGNLTTRLDMVIRAARTKNPNIKIVLEQFYTEADKDKNDFKILKDAFTINIYAISVARFIGGYYNKSLDVLPGSGSKISARINGWGVDVESSTLVDNLTDILSRVRAWLGGLADDLGSDKFSVSITPAWTRGLNGKTGRVIDYCMMQNYSGGTNTFADDYKAAGSLQDAQIAWGLCSEEPYQSTDSCKDFDGVKAQAEEARDQKKGIYTWRVNSDNRVFENALQVWLYNTVHGTKLKDSKSEQYIRDNWNNFGGRTAKVRDGQHGVLKEW